MSSGVGTRVQRRRLKIFPARLRAPLSQRLALLPPGWLILNWGCSMAGEPGTGSRACSRAYVLSRAGALAFARGAGVVDRAADWLIFDLSAQAEQQSWSEQEARVARRGLNASASAQNVVTHHGGLPPVVELSAARGHRLPRGTDLCATRARQSSLPRDRR